MLDDRLIEAFLAIIDQGSITKAASQLFLSQSTLSYRLKTLENQLGTTLVTRKRGSSTLELTSRGREFVPIAREWQDVSRRVEDFCHADEVLERVRIVSPESMSGLLLPVYRKIASIERETELSISTAQSRQIPMLVLTGEADIGISYLGFTEEGISTTRMGQVELMVLERGGEDRDTTTLSARDLDPSRAIAVRGITMEHDEVVRWHTTFFGPGFKPMVEVDSPNMLRSIMGNGSWCLVPENALGLFPEDQGFKAYSVSDADLSLSWYRVLANTRVDGLKKFCARYFPTSDDKGW